MATPKPWPEGTHPPDSATWLDWFLEQDRDDQLMLAASILAAQQTAAACWQEGHASIVATLELLEARMDELAQRGLIPAARPARPAPLPDPVVPTP